MKHCWGIRHLRYVWHARRFARQARELAGAEAGPCVNGQDWDVLEGIWAGRL